MTISLSALNVTKASETPIRVPFIDTNGEATGVVFLVLGDQSTVVKAGLQELLNEQRRAAAAAEARAPLPGEVNYRPVQDDVDFVNRSAALRLVGWEGIEETFTPDLGLELVKHNPEARDQIVGASSRVGRFTKRSAMNSSAMPTPNSASAE